MFEIILTVCKQMCSGSFKNNVTRKLFTCKSYTPPHTQIYVYTYTNTLNLDLVFAQCGGKPTKLYHYKILLGHSGLVEMMLRPWKYVWPHLMKDLLVWQLLFCLQQHVYMWIYRLTSTFKSLTFADLIICLLIYIFCKQKWNRKSWCFCFFCWIPIKYK